MFTLAFIGSAAFGARHVEIKAPITVQALRRLSGTLVATMTAITPLFTLLLAKVMIGEASSPWMLLSALLIVSGVLSIGYAEWKERTGTTRRVPDQSMR